jgi:hypothetical protein
MVKGLASRRLNEEVKQRLYQQYMQQGQPIVVEEPRVDPALRAPKCCEAGGLVSGLELGNGKGNVRVLVGGG